MKQVLAIRALDMAVALRQPPEGFIHHTDRGSQYCSNEYQRRLSTHGFKVSLLVHVYMHEKGALDERQKQLLPLSGSCCA
jgi:hypothetical protein